VPVGIHTILSQLEDPARSNVLDAGAGTGNYTFELSKKVGNIVAFEVNEGMISQMKNKI
jgi:16S rRNA A1518/A1519 N6-dimethyltransferase RsmA/KsgA/DIM1 with predicted DNA glycosylase/AP lyase activity